MARNIGLDLGSGKTSIVLRGRGTVLCEPTVAVINEEAEEMVAIGEKAAQMIGKVPPELYSELDALEMRLNRGYKVEH